MDFLKAAEFHRSAGETPSHLASLNQARGTPGPNAVFWREDFGGLALPASARLPRAVSPPPGPKEKEAEKRRLQEVVNAFMQVATTSGGCDCVVVDLQDGVRRPARYTLIRGSGPMALSFNYAAAVSEGQSQGESQSSSAPTQTWPLAQIRNIYHAQESSAVRNRLEDKMLNFREEELGNAVLMEHAASASGRMAVHTLQLVVLESAEQQEQFHTALKILRLYSQASETTPRGG